MFSNSFFYKIKVNGVLSVRADIVAIKILMIIALLTVSSLRIQYRKKNVL